MFNNPCEMTNYSLSKAKIQLILFWVIGELQSVPLMVDIHFQKRILWLRHEELTQSRTMQFNKLVITLIFSLHLSDCPTIQFTT